VYKSPGRIWSDADIAELLNFRNKCILAGDLNAKRPFWNSAVWSPSGQKLLQMQINSKSQRHNVRPIDPLREISWSTRISDSHMSVSQIFWTHTTTSTVPHSGSPWNWKTLGATNWERFQSLASNWFLMTPSIATKFQYVNSPFFYFPSLTTCFDPYGPSLGEIYN
jgi:hypothetical protein